MQAGKNISVRVRKRQYLRKRHLSPRKRRVCGRSPSQKTLRVWEVPPMVPPRKRCVRGTGRSRPENVCVHGRSCTGARAHTRKRCVRGRSCPENVACVGGPARARARALAPGPWPGPRYRAAEGGLARRGLRGSYNCYGKKGNAPRGQFLSIVSRVTVASPPPRTARRPRQERA